MMVLRIAGMWEEGVLRWLHKLKIETVVMLPRPPYNHDLAGIVTTEHASL